MKLNLLKLHYIFKAYVNTSRTITIEKEQPIQNNVQPENKKPLQEDLDIIEESTVPSLKENRVANLMDRIKQNNATLQDINDKAENIAPVMPNNLGIASPHINNDKPSHHEDDASWTNPENIIHKVQIPDTKIDVEESQEKAAMYMAKVEASTKVIGHQATETIQRLGVVLEETEVAEERQKSLLKKVEDFAKSLNFSPMAKRIGIGIALTYTVWHIYRYRQIPLGGFLKGLFTGGGNAVVPTNSVSEITANVNPVNNFHINYPQEVVNAIKENKTADNIFVSLITAIGPLNCTLMVCAVLLYKYKTNAALHVFAKAMANK